jgi:hemoglobin
VRPALFEFAGGEPAFLALAAAHHVRCLEDPELNHPFSHPDQHPQHVERLAAYWAEVMGGPPRYSQSCGDQSDVLRMHGGNGDMGDLGERFLNCFDGTLDDAELPADPAFRAALLERRPGNGRRRRGAQRPLKITDNLRETKIDKSDANDRVPLRRGWSVSALRLCRGQDVLYVRRCPSSSDDGRRHPSSVSEPTLAAPVPATSSIRGFAVSGERAGSAVNQERLQRAEQPLGST